MEETSVIIIGGGIVGLSAALFLQHHDVPFTLIERHSSTSIHPRARGVNARTMEMYREVGVAEEVQEIGNRRKQEGGILSANTLREGLENFDGEFGRKMMGTMVGKLENFTPCPALRGARITQDLLEPVLLKHLRERGGDARFYTSLISFSQNEEGVSCEVQHRETQKITTIKAKYMIAADGANSFVRRQLGAPVGGKGILGKLVNVLFKCDMEELVTGKEFSLCRIDREEVVGLFTSINLKDVWVFHILDKSGSATSSPEAAQTGSAAWQQAREATMAYYTPAECERLIKIALGMPEKKVEVVSVLPWDSAMHVMENFIHGRIFFAGDSAHVMPPWGGQGANSGIADVHNLAWKLAYVLSARAPPSLLDTYQTERYPIDFQCAQESADAADSTGLIETSGFGGGRGGGGGGKKFLPPWLLMPIISGAMSFVFRYSWLLGYFFPKIPALMARMPRILGYGSNYANLATKDDGPNSHPLGLDGRPGTRCPHIWLKEDGKEFSTVDKFGKKFVVLTGKDGALWQDAARELKMDDILEAYVINTEEGDLVPKNDGEWETVAGIQPDGALLVRPDGVVGWRSKSMKDDCAGELKNAMDRLLCK
eukprot:Phypoly_transcript_05287.p1 GENE.Phypoly_transcript_05287~~Phypoly_transcript_05287.p1  ORF type:complete len:599 (+),score=98.34 Phypoly_transcript_05287:161-1957(+)